MLAPAELHYKTCFISSHHTDTTSCASQVLVATWLGEAISIHVLLKNIFTFKLYNTFTIDCLTLIIYVTINLMCKTRQQVTIYLESCQTIQAIDVCVIVEQLIYIFLVIIPLSEMPCIFYLCGAISMNYLKH